jgi:hypothetical protein
MRDYPKKYYAMMRCALGTDITYVIAANPSSLIQLHRIAVENMEDIIRDIAEGTLKNDVRKEIDETQRDTVMAAFQPDPKRAKELESLVNKYDTHVRPKHYWPNLVCINTWKQGNCSRILPQLKEYYPDHTVIREFGFIASEGRLGIVLDNSWDYSLCAAHYYHFEFIPEEERDSTAPVVLSAHQVEEGKRYYMVFTNMSGLFRYDINDVVEVCGFYNQFPLFRFLHKGAGVTSLTGEKLTETQLLMAMKQTEKQCAVNTEFYILACDEMEYGYRLFVEFFEENSPEEQQRFIDTLDSQLQELNGEYKAKRGSQRLAKPQIVLLPPDSYVKLKKDQIAHGLAREGQYKVTHLTSKRATIGLLRSLSHQKSQSG